MRNLILALCLAILIGGGVHLIITDIKDFIAWLSLSKK
jgi:hypothetical protein